MSVCRGLLQPSKQQNLIAGLNLLRLLVQNRIAEFHTELELIPQEVTYIVMPYLAHILSQYKRQQVLPREIQHFITLK